MNEPFRDPDEAIERILAWRAERAAPTGLLEEINARLDMEPRRRGRGILGTLPQVGRLAWLLLLVALVAAIAVGATMSGARVVLPALVPPGPTNSPLAAQGARLQLADCTAVRALPFDPANIDLTGTWHDRTGIYYFRQIGNEVWGAQRFTLGADSGRNAALTGYPWTVLHGTVGPGPVVSLDWADAGSVAPAGPSTSSSGSGSVVFNVVNVNGGVQLVASSQSGAERLSGPAYADLTLLPCTPAVTEVP